jgi:hypothetical protein
MFDRQKKFQDLYHSDERPVQSQAADVVQRFLDVPVAASWTQVGAVCALVG